MAHWRHTWKPARFFFMDARVVIALLPFLLHMRLWTFLMALVFMVLFWWLERTGMSFPAALRGLRSWLGGAVRPPRRRMKNRYPVDYGALSAISKASEAKTEVQQSKSKKVDHGE